jgi:hypothetical protein
MLSDVGDPELSDPMLSEELGELVAVEVVPIRELTLKGERLGALGRERPITDRGLWRDKAREGPLILCVKGLKELLGPYRVEPRFDVKGVIIRVARGSPINKARALFKARSAAPHELSLFDPDLS